ncbi:MAG TPA: hypothetical protein VGQ38_15570 [Gaiellaceae bacterium]|nr:hypothetical protein [Gaiellaceae bacterium]
MISTPPSAPVAWRCFTTSRNCVGIFVSSRTWFDARDFAAAHYSVSRAEIWCELLTEAEARDILIRTLQWRAYLLDHAKEAA